MNLLFARPVCPLNSPGTFALQPSSLAVLQGRSGVDSHLEKHIDVHIDAHLRQHLPVFLAANPEAAHYLSGQRWDAFKKFVKDVAKGSAEAVVNTAYAGYVAASEKLAAAKDAAKVAASNAFKKVDDDDLETFVHEAEEKYPGNDDAEEKYVNRMVNNYMAKPKQHRGQLLRDKEFAQSVLDMERNALIAFGLTGRNAQQVADQLPPEAVYTCNLIKKLVDIIQRTYPNPGELRWN